MTFKMEFKGLLNMESDTESMTNQKFDIISDGDFLIDGNVLNKAESTGNIIWK